MAMGLTLRCTDNVVLELTGVMGSGYIIEVKDVGETALMISLTSTDLRACFEGSPLHRAVAVAKLTPAQMNILSGATDKDGGPSQGVMYKTMRRLWRIGTRILDPNAREFLADDRLEVLDAAAQFPPDQPARQMCMARLHRLHRGLNKKGSMPTVPRSATPPKVAAPKMRRRA
jgi:hypothetical protein